ncbi:hypothetical protein CWE22_11710 [Pseudidiomarina aestuarii]|uniref:Uncharacterized protein n=1 Tax=Pseudidiomarina aestuarii TaxID=624146 RepID=A0A7Z7ESG9_9GAMM|nr:hypothetical protein [Pseudidiomarina aestuarii]RUO37895.1 hypothetical protein CWE22_11710 [Pseudidiomarina aestuarii]
MNSKPHHQLTHAQRQLLGALGIPEWRARTSEPVSTKTTMSYLRIGQWLIAAPEFPIPSPAWFTDFCQTLALMQTEEVSAAPVEVSASIAQRWQREKLIEFQEPLPTVPSYDHKRAWWKHLCQPR